jgi:CheY-like chemotaxis protein
MAGEAILIVDDSPLNLKLARILLKGQGYVIGTAKEGNEALSMVGTFKPQLILTDVQMPGIDGLEVVRRIKANPDTRDIIVVALTSYAMKRDEEKARSAGCDGYISKPFESRKLLLQIRQYLDARPVRESHSPRKRVVLVAEDDPVERKRLCTALEEAGFTTIAAEDGAEAIEKARLTTPDLIVSDILLPRLDGLTLCRAARNEPSLASVPILLRTARSVEKSDERMARDMGASALVSKTQDLEAFRHAVDTALSDDVAALQAELVSVYSITQEFLVEGEQHSRRLYEELQTGLDVQGARRCLHGWAGTAGSLGFPQISQAAFDLDTLLGLSASDVDMLETRFKQLLKLFADALEDARKVAPVLAEIVKILSGRSIALIGFDASEASRTQRLLQQARASCESVEPGQMHSGAGRTFDIAIVKLTGTGVASATQGRVLAGAEGAVLLVGPRELVIQAQHEYQSHVRDFLIEPYSAEEIRLRCCRLVSRSRIKPSALPVSTPAVSAEVARSAGLMTKSAQRPTRVLILDDDPTVIALVSRTLHGHEIECLAASHAGDVVRMAAQFKPDVIVLDVNLPQMDGFEVLASIKNDDRTKEIAVVMLTARQQEPDIMKGFGLGAADYIVKPFSPMELVARIRRLVRK